MFFFILLLLAGGQLFFPALTHLWNYLSFIVLMGTGISFMVVLGNLVNPYSPEINRKMWNRHEDWSYGVFKVFLTLLVFAVTIVILH